MVTSRAIRKNKEINLFNEDFMNKMAEKIATILEEKIIKLLAPRLMNMDQSSVFLQQVSESAMRQHVSNGHIPKNCIKHIGGLVYLDRVELVRWLETQ